MPIIPPFARPLSKGEFTQRVLILFVLTGIAFFFYKVSDLLLMLFGSVLLAVILSSASHALHRRTGIPRGWALAIVVIVLLLVVGSIFALFGARIARQADVAAAAIPSGLTALRARLVNYSWGQRAIDELQHMNYAAAGSDALGRAFGVLSSALGVVTDLILIFFSGLYLAAQPDIYLRGVLSLTPPRYRDRMAAILDAAYDGLRHWMAGQLVSMVVVGALFGVALSLIGVPAPVVLGLIAALSEFVPLVGPVIATIPAVLEAMTQSLSQVIWVVVAFLVIQQLESNLLVPYIQRKAVELPPVLALFATVTFGLLFGIAGLLFAVPLVVLLMVVVRKAYVEDILGGAEPEDAPELRALVTDPEPKAASRTA